MTRFLLSLEEVVDTVFAAIRGGRKGETYIPRVPSARMVDVARALIGDREIETVVTGIRPGEKVHEILISEEEGHRSVDRGRFYAIRPVLPELHGEPEPAAKLPGEYSSGDDVMSYDEVVELLTRQNLMIRDQAAEPDGVELLR
jgi:UDP-glucose 4-epimerase